jgi:hypothetical protein
MTIQDFIDLNMARMAKQFSEPPVPIMSQEEYEALPRYKKAMLTCNVIGCKDVVCSHGMLCLDHHLGRKPIEQIPFAPKNHDV